MQYNDFNHQDSSLNLTLRGLIIVSVRRFPVFLQQHLTYHLAVNAICRVVSSAHRVNERADLSVLVFTPSLNTESFPSTFLPQSKSWVVQVPVAVDPTNFSALHARKLGAVELDGIGISCPHDDLAVFMNISPAGLHAPVTCCEAITVDTQGEWCRYDVAVHVPILATITISKRIEPK